MRLSTCVKITFSIAHLVSSELSRKCDRIHGHNYILEVCFTKDNPLPWVEDFKKLKEIVESVVSELDHHLILPEKMRNMFNIDEDHIRYLPLSEVTCEELARYLWLRIYERLSREGLELKITKLKLYETNSSWVEVEE